MIEALIILLTATSWVYWMIACWWTREFFLTPQPINHSYTPPVSILKPVRGIDPFAYDNFVTFCRQDYPDYEILFGVAEADDPVIPLIKCLQNQFPERSIRLVITPPLGFNRKVGILHALAGEAQYETLVISDSDMRVTPDYLRRVTSPLSDAQVGMVTCPYRGELPLTLTARLEALHMNVTFLPSVMVARRFLTMSFALGASVALRKRDLARMGSFAAIADYLADDYQLGARISALGLRVQLSDYVMAAVLGATTFREQWDREIRWARCTRVSRPLEYPGLLLSFSTPLALLLLLITGFTLVGVLMLLGSLLIRWVVGWLVTGYIGDKSLRRWLVWLPIRDCLSALVWCAGGLGNRVKWRGERFGLSRDGRLKTLTAQSNHAFEEPSDQAVR